MWCCYTGTDHFPADDHKYTGGGSFQAVDVHAIAMIVG